METGTSEAAEQSPQIDKGNEMRPELMSKVLTGGSVVLLIQNIIVLVTFLFIMIKAMGETFEASDAKIVEIFFISFYIDIIAFILLGVGFLLCKFRVGITPSPNLEKTALMAGIFTIAWALVAALWRHILPRLAADSAINLFVGDATVDEFLLYVRLTVLLAVIGAVLFAIAFFFIKKFFNEYEMDNQVNLVQPKKNPALNTLFQGAVMNMVFNLIIFGPLLAVLGGSDWEGFADDDTGAIMALTFLIKMIAIPLIMIIGCIGLLRTSQGLVKPFQEGGYQTFLEYSTGAGAAGTSATKPSKPAEKTPAQPPNCASCGKPTDYIEQYSRHYCHQCKKYA